MTEETQIQIKDIKLPTTEEMLSAGVHFGHKTSKWNPKMKPYIFGARNGVHIIDLEKSLAKLKEAAEFMADLASKGGIVLFVGTTPSSKKIIYDAAKDINMPYVISRWPGGALTNFKSIGKRLEYFRNLEKQMAEGELKKYTKKEQLGFKKELDNLSKTFEGIKNMTKLPEAIFVTDLNENKLAVREAKKSGIKVIAICDTNTNPNEADYCIPGNDEAVSSIKLLVAALMGAIKG